jgi:hypothetical protein
VDCSGDVGEFTSIALDSSDKVHISYWDWTTNQDLKYTTNTTGSWVTTTVDSEGRVGSYTSIAIDLSGNGHISYYDRGNRDLKYAINSSGSWVTTTVDSSGIVGFDTSIVLDSSGNVHISYYDNTNKDLKYATTQVEAEANPLSASGGEDKNLGCQINSPKASDKYDAKSEAAKSRSLWLMNSLIESSIWCNEKLGIKTPEAVALVRAFDAAKKSPLSTKAEEAKMKVHQLAEKIARTEEGQRKIAASKNLASIEEQGYSRGQPTWEKALEALQTANDAANSTPLGHSLQKATQEAVDAILKANKSKEMGTAVEAFIQYNCANRARISTASPEEQTKLTNDYLSCHESWSAYRMKQAQQHMDNPFYVRFGF